MERCPTPRVIRYPSVAVIGHCPITVCSIWMEVAMYTRYPKISIIVVFNPITIR